MKRVWSSETLTNGAGVSTNWSGTKLGPFTIHVDGPKLGFKESTLLLSASILDFVVKREQGTPPYPSSDDAATWTDQQALLRAYDADTMKRFREVLGSAVENARHQLLRRGLQDPTLDRLYNDPGTTAGIKIIGHKLHYLAEKLPPDEPPSRQTSQTKHPKQDSKAVAPPPSAPPVTLQNSPGSAVSYNQQGGVTAGTFIQGDPPPQFILTTISENTPQDGLYETNFKLQVTTARSIVLRLKARATRFVGEMRITKEVPLGAGGEAFMSMLSRRGPTLIEENYQNIESGSYTITLHTAQPDKVTLEYH